MSEKRKRETSDDAHLTKKKRGFTVGPQNLPDGTYRRKTQEIKRSLIDKAKIRKTYAKLKAQVPDVEGESIPVPASHALDTPEDARKTKNIPHPDRQNLIDAEEAAPEETSKRAGPRPPRQRKPKPAPFRKEHEEGQRRKAEAEERCRAREKAEQDRKTKLEEREKFRSAMAKARTGGFNGQRKLGRESKPLLDKVKRLMAQEGS